MLQSHNSALLVGAGLSVVAALLHVACTIGGPAWYQGIGESIRPRSLKGPPARRNLVLETCLELRASVLCQFRSPPHPPEGRDRGGFSGSDRRLVGAQSTLSLRQTRREMESNRTTADRRSTPQLKGCQ